MMVSPDYFRSEYEKLSYEELIKKRDELMEYIKKFEEGRISKDDYNIHPSPDVIYQMNHEYLAEIAPLIAEKYRDKRDRERE